MSHETLAAQRFGDAASTSSIGYRTITHSRKTPMMSRHYRAPKTQPRTGDLPFERKGRGLSTRVLRNSFANTPLWHKGRALGHVAWCKARRLAASVRKLVRSVRPLAVAGKAWLKAAFAVGLCSSGMNSVASTGGLMGQWPKQWAPSVYLARAWTELRDRTPHLARMVVAHFDGELCFLCGHHSRLISCNRYRLNVIGTSLNFLDDFEDDAVSNGFTQELLVSILGALVSRVTLAWGENTLRREVAAGSMRVLLRLVPPLRALRMGSEIASIVFTVVTGRKNPVAAFAERKLEDWFYETTGRCTVDAVVEAISSLVYQSHPARDRLAYTAVSNWAYSERLSDAMEEYVINGDRLLLHIPWIIEGMIGSLPWFCVDGYLHRLRLMMIDVISPGSVVPFSDWVSYTFDKVADIVFKNWKSDPVLGEHWLKFFAFCEEESFWPDSVSLALMEREFPLFT